MRILRGITASKGKALGKARIILSEKDFINFQRGEVLVTESTTPDFVPIMKMAIAIVCNTGGILSHSAIIARELKIPCINGINGATKIIKTGDRLKIDTKNGVVIKLD